LPGFIAFLVASCYSASLPFSFLISVGGLVFIASSVLFAGLTFARWKWLDPVPLFGAT
jgi:hypothetical protein